MLEETLAHSQQLCKQVGPLKIKDCNYNFNEGLGSTCQQLKSLTHFI